MKKVFVIAMAAVLAVALIVPSLALADQAVTGNGAPSGEHVTLNIIGVQNVKDADMTYPEDDPSGRSTIFVLLDGTTRIYLQDGGDIDVLDNWKDAFGVIDANGTDGVAKVQVADPDYDAYVIQEYEPGEEPDTICDYLIMARPLGKPGGLATMTTCAELADATQSDLKDFLDKPTYKSLMNVLNDMDGDAYCSIQQVPQGVTLRETGKKLFTDVTAYLTSVVFAIWIDVNNNQVQDEGDEIWYIRVPIFHDLLEGEYWKYDNGDYDGTDDTRIGLKHLQIRFYPIETDITYADEGLDPVTL